MVISHDQENNVSLKRGKVSLSFSYLDYSTLDLKDITSSVEKKTGTTNNGFMAIALSLCWRDQRAVIMRGLYDLFRR